MKLPARREVELLVLVIQERTGREVAALYREETGKRMPFGTLYTTFSAMERRGWVTVRQQADGADGRVRKVKITPRGVSALQRAHKEHARIGALARQGYEAALRRS